MSVHQRVTRVSLEITSSEHGGRREYRCDGFVEVTIDGEVRSRQIFTPEQSDISDSSFLIRAANRLGEIY